MAQKAQPCGLPEPIEQAVTPLHPGAVGRSGVWPSHPAKLGGDQPLTPRLAGGHHFPHGVLRPLVGGAFAQTF